MKANFKNILVMLAMVLAAILMVSFLSGGMNKTETFSYSDLKKMFEKDIVQSFEVDENLKMTLKVYKIKTDESGNELKNEDGSYIFATDDKGNYVFQVYTYQISYTFQLEDINRTAYDSYTTPGSHLTTYNYKAAAATPWYQLYLPYIIIAVVFIGLWIFVVKQSSAMGGGKMNSFSKSRAKVAVNDKNAVKFADVAGADEEKAELEEVVEFLKDPAKFVKLGARIPRGVLLVGPPGTGKTLLAKAVAGEAGVPFFSISGSDFVEMYVGVGASRVRDLFESARRTPASIIFIDEIDAVGRARGKNVGFSSNDERENTLNQLLTEMDGFDTNSGVIILAATNRADILDKALLRAGRFDRQIHVDLPELKEREEIFKVHTRNLKTAQDFDLGFMAQHTPGFSGADIANVCNEAALTAARKDKKEIDRQDFLDAVDRIVGGLERKGSIMTPAEKKTTAYHEAGHATVGWLLPYSDPVFKVSLIPRGDALGLTWYLPDERKILSKSYLMDKMCALIGGRVAEEIINGEPATGALNDLERLTRMAYNMVQYYGMSEKVGEISFYDSTGSRGYDLSKPYSEKTAELMDQEVKDLVNEIHDRTLRILTEHKEGFVQMARLLLEKEVIFAEDIERILGPKVKPDEAAEEKTDNEPEKTATEDE